MQFNEYETVFILNPVLSEEQTKDTVAKFKKVLTDNGAQIVHEDNWGLRKFAYPIDKKSSGYYTVLHFQAAPTVIKTLETEYHRDERVLRSLVVRLDKHAVAYLQKRYNRLSETPAQN
jgi:small subunit ribosomal protein S6